MRTLVQARLFFSRSVLSFSRSISFNHVLIVAHLRLPRLNCQRRRPKGHPSDFHSSTRLSIQSCVNCRIVSYWRRSKGKSATHLYGFTIAINEAVWLSLDQRTGLKITTHLAIRTLYNIDRPWICIVLSVFRSYMADNHWNICTQYSCV